MIDLDAARAQRAEAGGAGTTVRFGGEDFIFPPVKAWPIGITDALSSGDLAGALKLLLDEDYERFAAHNPTMGDLEALFDGLGKESGVGELPNSSGSAVSSLRTPRRSKRTS